MVRCETVGLRGVVCGVAERSDTRVERMTRSPPLFHSCPHTKLTYLPTYPTYLHMQRETHENVNARTEFPDAEDHDAAGEDEVVQGLAHPV